MSAPASLRCLVNPRPGIPGLVTLPEGGWRRARAAITAWPGHAPAPPIDLPEPAAGLGLAALHWKGAGRHAGPGGEVRGAEVRGAEVLGAAYAVQRLLSAELARRGVARAAEAPELESGRLAEATRGITLASGPDAGFALAVAWGARRFHARCVALLPPDSPPAWREALAHQGAEVLECPAGPTGSGCTVRDAARHAEAEGWIFLSDHSWSGQTEVARDVMQGCRLAAEEAFSALPAPPSHVFVPGGSGALAAAVAVQSRRLGGDAPRLVVVEAEDGEMMRAAAASWTGAGQGEAEEGVSLLAWGELERAAFACLAVPSEAVAGAGRSPPAGRAAADRAGERGEAVMAGLLLAARDPAARAALGLDAGSRVLAFGTGEPFAKP